MGPTHAMGRLLQEVFGESELEAGQVRYASLPERMRLCEAKGWIHSDDILTLGSSKSTEMFAQKINKDMMVKRRAKLGWGPKDDKKVTLQCPYSTEVTEPSSLRLKPV
eukprot:700561-Amphidinium_carterae.3